MPPQTDSMPVSPSESASPDNQAVLQSVATTNASSHKRSSLTSTLDKSRNVPIVEVSLENVSYTPIDAALKKGRKATVSAENRVTVLHNITTKISPYKLTAWMGPSGSGKTSLTSVVAGLVDPADIAEGSIVRVNGEEGSLPKRLVGVVWQDDLLLSNLTVEETIRFAARLKTPQSVSDEDLTALVEETMQELGLIHIRDNLIGSALSNVPGISGGERKRTSVAAELVVRPSLLLLDEPTSGLDATTARALVQTLKDLAGIGHSIAVVIHQPRTDIYKMFDHLLLLSKGHTIFDGNAEDARCHLESCPTVAGLPEETGIADWLLDTVIEDEKKNLGGSSALAAHWKRTVSNPESPVHSKSSSAPKQILQRMSTLAELEHTTKKYEASFFVQLQLLLQRTMKQRRGEKLTNVSIVLTATYVVFTCLSYWQLPNDTSATFQRNSLLFFMLIAQGNSIVVGSMQIFQRERALLRRERAKKMYGVLPFFIAKASSDMTNNILLPLIYSIIVYFAVGLRLSAAAFFKFVLAYYFTLSTAQSMGFLLSILIPSMPMALIIAPTLTLMMFVLGGFYIPLNEMHPGIKWASYVTFARYGYSALLINEFGGRDIPCAEGEVAVSIGDPDVCPVPGDSVFENMGYEGIFANYWFDVGIVIVMQVTLLSASYWMLRRSK